MGIPPVLNYQDPLTKVASLDYTPVDPGPSGGIPTVRENVQVFSSFEDRQSRQMDSLFQSDQSDLFQARRHTERISPSDRRGGTGRGSTR